MDSSSPPASSPVADTPVDWIEAWSDADSERPCLIFLDGTVTYGQLAAEVTARARTVGRDVDRWEVVPIVARLDLPSIVDILAHMSVGAVPLPHGGDGFGQRGLQATGAIVCLSTSGSSGDRRLVPLTMGNLSASIAASRDRLGTGPQDRWLGCLPLTHIGGLSVLLRSFEAGGAAVIGEFGRQTTDLIRHTEPTVASLVPTMVHRLVASDPDVIASIGTVLVGGAALSQALAGRARRYGVDVVPTYGMTETSSQVATPSPDDALGRPGWVGQPLAGFSVSIESTGDGRSGRIMVDGPAVFSGYLGREPRSGPLVTSDVGLIESDGSLVVLGRADDMVVTGGENVALPRVLETLTGLPGVDGAAVVGVDDPEWGTAVCALLVTADLEAVQVSASELLERHEIPKRWAVTDRIPMLANGKIDAETTREFFEGNANE